MKFNHWFGSKIIDAFDYWELDCTFDILKPYALCMPTLVKNNLSLPIGFVIGPSESFKICDIFFECLEFSYNGITKRIQLLPILSDLGKGLRKLCYKRCMKQYFCIRHIINAIGPSSPLGKIAASLLMISTYDVFSRKFAKMIDLAVHFIKGSKNPLPNSNNFCEIFGIQITDDGYVIQSEGFIESHALHRRGIVASCSNHVEGRHKIFKSISKFQYNSINRLYCVIKTIKLCFKDYQLGKIQLKPFKRSLMKLRKRSHQYMQKDTCDCNGSDLLRIQLGVEDFPCIHTCHKNKEYKIPAFPDFNNLEMYKEPIIMISVSHNKWNFKMNLKRKTQKETFNLYNVIAQKPI